MKKLLLLGTALMCLHASQAQLLKKLKDKVNKTINKEDEHHADASDPRTGAAGSAAGQNSSSWCDTVKVDVTGADGVTYNKIYSGPSRMDIVYAESSIGLSNDPSGYRLILSEYVNGKHQFVVVENGKVIDTDTKVKPAYLGRGLQPGSSDHNEGEGAEMKKYIVADSSKVNIPKTDAKSVTLQEIDNDQSNMALEILRQTDDYKKLSPEEQKKLEDEMSKGIAYNNSMAGKKINVGGQEASSYSSLSGYKVIVKGKLYGKFMMPPALAVSDDQAMVYIVGLDEKANPLMIAQGKKTLLDKSRFTGIGGKMIMSPDHKKSVYVEQKQMSDAEMMEVSSGKKPITYNVLRPDGTGFLLPDYNNSGKFRLLNTGALISLNESTGELYSDNKKLGKFNLVSGGSVETDAVMIGATPRDIAYYDGPSGSLNYLDGTVKKLGIMYPAVISQNGKSYLTWFRKCRSDIFLARFSY